MPPTLIIKINREVYTVAPDIVDSDTMKELALTFQKPYKEIKLINSASGKK